MSKQTLIVPVLTYLICVSHHIAMSFPYNISAIAISLCILNWILLKLENEEKWVCIPSPFSPLADSSSINTSLILPINYLPLSCLAAISNYIIFVLIIQLYYSFRELNILDTLMCFGYLLMVDGETTRVRNFPYKLFLLLMLFSLF